MDRETPGVIILIILVIVVLGISAYSYLTPAEIGGIQYSNGTIIAIPSPVPTPTAYPMYYIYRNGTKSPYTGGGIP